MSKTVLTIDDSRTMREMLNHALVEAGYRVIQAVDGVDGLEVLQANAGAVDVVIIVKPFNPVKLVDAVRRVAA